LNFLIDISPGTGFSQLIGDGMAVQKSDYQAVLTVRKQRFEKLSFKG
jgi:phage-related protein